jgi:hypothetical protein
MVFEYRRTDPSQGLDRETSCSASVRLLPSVFQEQHVSRGIASPSLPIASRRVAPIPTRSSSNRAGRESGPLPAIPQSQKTGFAQEARACSGPRFLILSFVRFGSLRNAHRFMEEPPPPHRSRLHRDPHRHVTHETDYTPAPCNCNANPCQDRAIGPAWYRTDPFLRLDLHDALLVVKLTHYRTASRTTRRDKITRRGAARGGPSLAPQLLTSTTWPVRSGPA